MGQVAADVLGGAVRGTKIQKMGHSGPIEEGLDEAKEPIVKSLLAHVPVGTQTANLLTLAHIPMVEDDSQASQVRF